MTMGEKEEGGESQGFCESAQIAEIRVRSTHSTHSESGSDWGFRGLNVYRIPLKGFGLVS